METKEERVQRSLVLEIYIPRGPKHPGTCTCEICKSAVKLRHSVINDIKTVRDALRKGASVLFLAEAATATIEQKNDDIKISPAFHTETISKDGKNKEVKVPDSKTLLEMTFGKTGALQCYSMRDWIKSKIPGWRSEIADWIRDRIVTVWQGKDPEFPKASRGWLTLNFARRVAAFNGSPIAIRRGACEALDHHVILSWRPGESIKFNIGDMDPSRFGIWRNIVSGKFKMSDPITLNYKDTNNGTKFFLNIPYSRPAKQEKDLDENRHLEIAFTDNKHSLIEMCVRQGHETFIDELRSDCVNVVVVLDQLDKLRKQMEYLSECRKGCGNRHELRVGDGNKKAFDAISRRSDNVSKTRENLQKLWNHTWARRVAETAKKWRCGKIVLIGLPKKVKGDETSGGIIGRPWQWSDFLSKLDYRCKEYGIELSSKEKIDVRITDVH